MGETLRLVTGNGALGAVASEPFSCFMRPIASISMPVLDDLAVAQPEDVDLADLIARLLGGMPMNSPIWRALDGDAGHDAIVLGDQVVDRELDVRERLAHAFRCGLQCLLCAAV